MTLAEWDRAIDRIALRVLPEKVLQFRPVFRRQRHAHPTRYQIYLPPAGSIARSFFYREVRPL